MCESRSKSSGIPSKGKLEEKKKEGGGEKTATTAPSILDRIRQTIRRKGKGPRTATPPPSYRPTGQRGGRVEREEEEQPRLGSVSLLSFILIRRRGMEWEEKKRSKRKKGKSRRRR